MSFYIEHNRALEKISHGEIALGIQLRSRSAPTAELLGHLGFDFLYIETEHFACNDETVEELARAAQISGITPWIRVTNSDPEYIGHLLDIGIKGVIIPHLDTPEQARMLVSAVKYPPLGRRGSGMMSRAADYGLIDRKRYIEAANRNCSAIGMIESVRGLENLEAILDSGIDMIRVGMNDLALEMGIENKKAPEFVAVLRRITALAKEKGVPVGASAMDVDSAIYYQSLGFTFFCLGSEFNFLQHHMPPFLASIREALSH